MNLPLILDTRPVEFIRLGTYRPRFGFVYLVGEVINRTDKPLNDARFEATFQNPKDDRQTNIDFGLATHSSIAPGESSLFYIFSTIEPTWEPTGDVWLASSWPPTAYEYARPTIVSVYPYSDAVYVQLRNDDTVPLADIQVYAWSYSEQTSSYTLGRTMAYLEPGETFTVAIQTDDALGWPTDSEIHVEAEGIRFGE